MAAGPRLVRNFSPRSPGKLQVSAMRILWTDEREPSQVTVGQHWPRADVATWSMVSSATWRQARPVAATEAVPALGASPSQQRQRAAKAHMSAKPDSGWHAVPVTVSI